MHDPTTKRGFAAVPPDRRREISRMGGRAIPRDKRAFARDPELAKNAGSKGGHRRREAGEKDAQLLKQSLDGPVTLGEGGISGRTLRKVSRLLRLGYWTEVRPVKAGTTRYAITDEGRTFLARFDEEILS